MSELLLPIAQTATWSDSFFGLDSERWFAIVLIGISSLTVLLIVFA